jgi:hypothetical protein
VGLIIPGGGFSPTRRGSTPSAPIGERTWAARSYDFDGVDDYVLANGAASVIDFNNDPHTVSVWFKIARGTPAKPLSGLWAFTNSAAGNSRYWLSISATGSVVIYGWGNTGGTYPVGSGGAPVTSGSGLDDDAWHNVIVTYNGSNTLKAYIDGGSPASFTVSAGALTSDTLAFGARRVGGTTDYAANGKIHQLSIYTSELSAAQCAVVYNGGKTVNEAATVPAANHLYRFGSTDNMFPTLVDYSTTPQNGTAVNMTASQQVEDSP